jgi:hypothetical protein
MADSTSDSFGPTTIVSTYEGWGSTSIRISPDLNKLSNGQTVFYSGMLPPLVYRKYKNSFCVLVGTLLQNLRTEFEE